MQMGLSQEQGQFQEALRRYFPAAGVVEALRRHEASGHDFDAAVWSGLVDLGVVGMLVPESSEGSGLGLLDAALAAEMLGEAAAPVPFAGAVAMASRSWLHVADEALRALWLARLAGGDARFTVAFTARWTGQTGRAHGELAAGDRLTGAFDAVPDSAGATHAIVYLDDGQVVLADLQDAGVTVSHPKGLDITRGIRHLSFDGAVVHRLDMDADPASVAQQVVDVGRVMVTADTLGAAQAMLDRSVAFANERVQFGRPVGSFQGVKYMCADMVTMLEPCRALVWQAAQMLGETSVEARVAALQAKAHVADVAREISRMAIEVHGGAGFTDLTGMPYWFRRIAFNRQMLGTPERCRMDAARIQGWIEA